MLTRLDAQTDAHAKFIKGQASNYDPNYSTEFINMLPADTPDDIKAFLKAITDMDPAKRLTVRQAVAVHLSEYTSGGSMKINEPLEFTQVGLGASPLTFADIKARISDNTLNSEFNSLKSGGDLFLDTLRNGTKDQNRYKNNLPTIAHGINNTREGYLNGDKNKPLKDGGILHNMQGPLAVTSGKMVSHIYDMGKNMVIR